MTPLNSTLIFRSILAIGLVVLCGCPGAPPETKSVAQPFRGQEVELVVPASLRLPALWEVAANEWMNQTGATIRWNEYDNREGSDAGALEKTLSAPVSPGGRVILFPLRDISHLDRYLDPIETTDDPGLDLKNIFKGLRDRVVSRNRSVVAIPVAAPVLLCYHRADLLKAAGLKPPQSWDDYQSLLDSLDRWAPGLTAVEPLAPGYRSTLFYARSLAFTKHPENYSIWFDLASGNPLLKTAGFEEAVEVAARAWKKMPPSIGTMTPADCRRQILEGKAALAIGIEPVSATDAASFKRTAGIEIGITRLPGSHRVFNPNSNRWDVLPQSAVHAPAICGFEGMAIGVDAPAGGGRNAAAWNLLATLAGDHFGSNWASLPKSPCRESQVGTATGWNESGLTVEEASQAVDATAQSLRDDQLVADLPIPSAADFHRVTDETIGKVLQSELDPAGAVQHLQAAFEQIVSRIGAASIRADYRRGLGLPDLEPVRGAPGASPDNSR
jgi:multiple sugar transport system substrate-binding protein